MTGGSESVAGDKDGGTTITTQIPVGWQRKVENGTVSYISPNGTVLRSVDEVRVYLWTDGTCKCGLECPLVPNKVFNFDPVGMVQAPGHQTGKVEEDMTKLCNHRRKVDAMEALCQSMQPSQLARLAHATGVACTVDGKEPRGSVLAHGDGAHCTYPQPRRNHLKSNSITFPLTSPRSVLQNGSVCHTPISRPPEQNSPLKKPITQTPIGSNTPAYVKQQWNPHSHPPRSQNILQRTLHNSTSPNNNLLPNSFSTCPSSSSTLIGRMHLPHPQGASVNSPPPLSVCSSPSRRDTFSPHQRSRHSSTSSLSDQGAPGSIFIQGVKLSPPTMPCSSPKPPVPPTSPCSRLEGILQHYKDCNTTNISSNTNSTIFSNQSNHHMSQAPMSAHLNPGDKRNGETAIPLNSAQAPGQLGRPLGHIPSQQKSQHHVSSSFPASSLLSAAAKAQLANQKTQSQLNTADVLSAIPLTGLDKEQQSKGTLSSHALVSTSVTCAPLVPTTGQEVCDPLTEQDKHTHTPHFLPPLLAHGVLGDLAALGNINSLHSLLGGGSLLIPQGTSLGVPLPQNQTPLNPLTCLQLTMAPALMGEKPVSLHETPPSQEELPSAQVSQDSLLNPVQTSAQQREGSSGTGLFDPYSSFMDTIYTSFLQVSERAEGGSDSTPLSYPELPSILQQASAPPSLSPRRACSVHNQDLSRLGMDMAQSPARGTPKLSEDPSTPPPSKPAGADALSDAPLHPVFMEEAKTDGSANMCVYSNGIGSGMEGRRQNGDDNEEEEDGRRLQGYLSPSERASREAGDDLSSRDTEQSRAEDVHTVSRRGRKRKQSLQRAPELPGGIDSIIEEPTAAMALSRPARSARGKRRRVMR
ncbi:methyl-CpG-binding domain protein 6-like isoform X2 [Xyrauchen texanus]|uniref:methyl-CpG-binding domain protein 6-like isoform X2 n=1 Tax=Xyrauchen texanus TaxID=154827 RepID=UPI0022427505|nr:methyl-CpG-binding domain protein 6-like isoform X2 [Xyrauchen texanus]